MHLEFEHFYLSFLFISNRNDKYVHSSPGEPRAGLFIASHSGVFREARFSSLPTNAYSTENNIPGEGRKTSTPKPGLS